MVSFSKLPWFKAISMERFSRAIVADFSVAYNVNHFGRAQSPQGTVEGRSCRLVQSCMFYHVFRTGTGFELIQGQPSYILRYSGESSPEPISSSRDRNYATRCAYPASSESFLLVIAVSKLFLQPPTRESMAI